MAKRILFQGDSITDAGRVRSEQNDGQHLGYGYPAFVAAELGTKYPGKYEFYNKGISGNKITNLYTRMKPDIIAMKPDYLSIMMGVNDVWHAARNDGVDDVRFEGLYRWMLEDIRAALPEVKIMLLSPYCTSTMAEKSEEYARDIPGKIAVVEKLAVEFGAVYVPMQKVMDDLCALAPAKYWSEDGVHPSIFGHKMIAETWLRVFEEKMAD